MEFDKRNNLKEAETPKSKGHYVYTLRLKSLITYM